MTELTIDLGRIDGIEGTPGPPGPQGVSPTITVTDIEGGHRITITDEDHPDGQSFDVMNGVPSEQQIQEAIAGIMDDAPTEGSLNPVTSDGIKSAIDVVDAKTSETSGAIFVPSSAGSPAFSGIATAYKQGKIVTAIISGSANITYNRGTAFAQLPSGFAPGTNTLVFGRVQGAAPNISMRIISFEINTAGQISPIWIQIEGTGVTETSVAGGTVQISAVFRCA